MTDEERAARKRSRRRENVVLVLCCLVFGGLAFWFAFTGGLEAMLLKWGIDLTHRQTEEEVVSEVVPLDTLDAYSWDQLSAISSEISRAGDGWRDVAYKYKLVTAEGQLTGGSKEIVLSDGTAFNVQIVGFNHDVRTDGSAPAGITFMSTSCVALRPMNEGDYAAGGREASQLRGWLDQQMAAMLPDDVARVIVSVLKPTNNVGRIDSFSAAEDAQALVWNTQDALWIPSAVEVCGPVDWFSSMYEQGYQRFDNLINAEGAQYQRFAEAGVTSQADPQGVLLRMWGGQPASWWYRTPYSYLSDDFYGVMPDGFPHTWTNSGGYQGVVVAFCV